MQNIYLLGTSHVAKQSVKQVKKAFEDHNPDIVALELDRSRAIALTTKTKRPKNLTLIRALGFSGFMFYLFGEFVQDKIGRLVKMEPGSEMLTAMKLAHRNNAKVAFIDRNIQITLRRFSKYFKKREILKLIWDMIRGDFNKKKYKLDFSKLPSEELIIEVIDYVKKRYPSLYNVLIKERDHFMAHNLLKLAELHPGKTILAVVGAGHVSGIKQILLNSNFAR